ncbi:MAG TPA: YihY/virulence factor BrkB family protein [Terriglobales bacterium]|nr:YihY/virulence factor BrkB family protein [Terriglobales bacterium]
MAAHSHVKEKAPSLWEFGGIGPIRLGKRVWSELETDDVYGAGAELSYYFLLALFPALLFIIALLGLLAEPGTQLRESLFHMLASVLPKSSSELITTTMSEVTGAAGAGKITFGILAALWAASNGMNALSKTLNRAYDVKETRPWWKVRLVSVLLTIGISFLIIGALTLVLFGGQLAELVAAKSGLGAAFATGWKIVQWPLVLAFLATAFATLYYFAPNLKKPEWYWISPGAVLGLGLWLAISFAFKLYLQFFDNYSKTYGSLGAVIILMLWFYLTALALLVGGEVNSEIGHVVEEGKKREKSSAEIERQLAA